MIRLKAGKICGGFGSLRFHLLQVASAFIIACAGAAICFGAISMVGINLGASYAILIGMFTLPVAQGGSLSTASVLTLGLVFGLKHAVEADHIAAVSAIVTERKSLLSSSIVGGLWGIGHTISLLAAGILVLLLDIQIGRKAELALEFCVAIMLIALGANAIRKLKRGATLHIHQHHHGGHAHLHPHIHDGAPEPHSHTHHGLRMNARPVLVGMMHGLAGSAAVLLLVLSKTSSPLTGLAYIAAFGVGSIGGMLAMSVLVSLPVQLTAKRFLRANIAVRLLAAIFSVGFGLFMVYEISILEGLFA